MTMQREDAKALPNSLPGALVVQYRERGGRRYGPYYFRCWRDKGVFHKQYVRREDVDAVRGACQRYRDHHQGQRQQQVALRQMLREYRATCQEVEQWLTRKQ